MNYFYPDSGDSMLTTSVDQMGPAYREYYRLSEEHVLETRFSRILRPTHHLLDVGCGEGRLAQTYLSRVARAVLLEPDAARLAQAKATVTRLGGQATFAPGPLSALEETFDVVLCSHVLQHVAAEKLLSELAGVVTPGGVLALATSFVLYGEGHHLQSFEERGELVAWIVSKERFDYLLEHPSPGVLPTRLFDRRALRGLLSRAGFDVLELRAYHVGFNDYARLGSGLEVDEKVNRSPRWAREREADVFVLARRRKPAPRARGGSARRRRGTRRAT